MRPQLKLAPEPKKAGELRIEREADGSLVVVDGASRTSVQPTRCFPWSAPGRYISLRDDKRKEVALVRDPTELDPDSRKALEQAMREAAFVLEVEKILHVEEEVEIRTWTVQTRQGKRTFQTAKDAWPRELPTGDYLVRDVAGDLYHIRDPEKLDDTSRRYLWAFVE